MASSGMESASTSPAMMANPTKNDPHFAKPSRFSSQMI
jgi:hypothetical protein